MSLNDSPRTASSLRRLAGTRCVKSPRARARVAIDRGGAEGDGRCRHGSHRQAQQQADAEDHRRPAVPFPDTSQVEGSGIAVRTIQLPEPCGYGEACTSHVSLDGVGDVVESKLDQRVEPAQPATVRRSRRSRRWQGVVTAGDRGGLVSPDRSMMNARPSRAIGRPCSRSTRRRACLRTGSLGGANIVQPELEIVGDLDAAAPRAGGLLLGAPQRDEGGRAHHDQDQGDERRQEEHAKRQPPVAGGRVPSGARLARPPRSTLAAEALALDVPGDLGPEQPEAARQRQRTSIAGGASTR